MSGRPREPARGQTMRILIDPGTFTFLNVGDTAMLQGAVTRLRALWPTAELSVLTDNPAGLAAECGAATAVRHEARRLWFSERVFLGRARRALPRRVAESVEGAQRRVRASRPRAFATALRVRLLAHPGHWHGLDAFRRALDSMTLVLVAGQGTLTDHAHAHAHDILHLLEAAHQRGVPTAMVGQGVGPVEDARLLDRARVVLPAVRLITLRERREGPGVLTALGVSPERVRATGDEAIPVAFARRPAHLGETLGVCARVSASSRIDAHLLDQLAPAVRRVASATRAPFTPVPINHADDPAAIARLLGNPEAAARWADESAPWGPAAAIRAAGTCRVMITAAYHAAVFALAQGVPAVCIARSAYFRAKFRGLADMFGEGCSVVDLDAPGAADVVEGTAVRLWADADALRPSLLDAAAAQAAAVEDSYLALRSTVRAA